jgi:hypothetical protein
VLIRTTLNPDGAAQLTHLPALMAANATVVSPETRLLQVQVLPFLKMQFVLLIVMSLAA